MLKIYTSTVGEREEVDTNGLQYCIICILSQIIIYVYVLSESTVEKSRENQLPIYFIRLRCLSSKKLHKVARKYRFEHTLHNAS